MIAVDQEAGNELDELSSLLDVDESDVNNKTGNLKPVREFNIFEKENETNELDELAFHSKVLSINSEPRNHDKSEVHHGDTDSSDDEDNKNTAEQKYTETGRDIKNVLKKQPTNTTLNPYTSSSSWKSNKSLFAPKKAATPTLIQTKDVYTDPYFGIRIITPLISSQVLQERMSGKTPVSFSKLQHHIAKSDKTSDWVIAGVIVSKTLKTSQKGKPYVCWTLSDLKDDLKTVSLFLFGKAYQKMWKTNTHIVVAVLNPSPLDSNKTSRDIAALSVINPDQVMVWGHSKDLGTCRARKKNGDPCTAIVNKNQCDVCIYHLKQEHQKFTFRSELQAPSGGGLTQLKNKVLGKNEVFYAGRSYTATVAKPVKKQVDKDQKRLKDLFNQCDSRLDSQMISTQAVKPAPSARVQLMKDAERLQKLTGTPATLASLSQEGDHASNKHCGKSVFKGYVNSEVKEIKREVVALETSIPQSFTKTGQSKIKTKELDNIKSLSSNRKPKCLLDGSKVQKCPKNKTQKTGLGHQGLKQNSTSDKKQPTKNRFDNLTKLKSNQSKTSQHGLKSNISKIQTSKSHCHQPQSLIDVCFDFDEYPTSKTPQQEASKNVSAPSLKKTPVTISGRKALTNRPSIDMTGESGLNPASYKSGKVEKSSNKPTTPLAENKTSKAPPTDDIWEEYGLKNPPSNKSGKVEKSSNKPTTTLAENRTSKAPTTDDIWEEYGLKNPPSNKSGKVEKSSHKPNTPLAENKTSKAPPIDDIWEEYGLKNPPSNKSGKVEKSSNKPNTPLAENETSKAPPIDDIWEEYGLKNPPSNKSGKVEKPSNKPTTPLAENKTSKAPPTDDIWEEYGLKNPPSNKSGKVEKSSHKPNTPLAENKTSKAPPIDDIWEEYGLKNPPSNKSGKVEKSSHKPNTPLAENKTSKAPPIDDIWEEYGLKNPPSNKSGKVEKSSNKPNTPLAENETSKAPPIDDIWEEYGLKNPPSNKSGKVEKPSNKPTTPLAENKTSKASTTDDIWEEYGLKNPPSNKSGKVEKSSNKPNIPLAENKTSKAPPTDDIWEEYGLKNPPSNKSGKVEKSSNKPTTPLAENKTSKAPPTDDIWEEYGLKNPPSNKSGKVEKSSNKPNTPLAENKTSKAPPTDDIWEEYGLKNPPSNKSGKVEKSSNKPTTPLAENKTSKAPPTDDIWEEYGLKNPPSNKSGKVEKSSNKPNTPLAENKTSKAPPIDDIWEEYGLKNPPSNKSGQFEKFSNKSTTPLAGSKTPISNLLSPPDFCGDRLGRDSTTKENAESTTPNTLRQTLPLRQSAAKLKALKYVQSKGPIAKEEHKKTDAKGSSLTNKRKRSEVNEDKNCENKPTLSKRFVELMNAESKHTDLISNAENRELDEYYDKMEKKEQLEEKMSNTYKVECKAVRCLKCNYKWFSAAERCKIENHPIKVISAVKRFFQCQNCKKRTVSLDIIPMRNCSGCNVSSWIRVPMLKERKSTNVPLSIRGGEQKFTNSVVADANLDLLVPDDNP